MVSELKHVLTILLMPLSLAALLACVGVILKWTRRPRLAALFISGACVMGLGSTLGPVANGLLFPLESQYPAVLSPTKLATIPRYIVVLGSGYSPRPGLPAVASLEPAGVVRFAEAVRLLRLLPGSALVLSGGAVGKHPPSAFGYAALASELGVLPQSLLIIDTPRDTEDEILALRDRVGDAAVLLVTSAAHMPRAMAYCAKFGVHAIAAPTGQLSGPLSESTPFTWLPSGMHLLMTESALHEYLGLLAMRLGIS